jgi:hypothetical protein
MEKWNFEFVAAEAKPSHQSGNFRSHGEGFFFPTTRNGENNALPKVQ